MKQISSLMFAVLVALSACSMPSGGMTDEEVAAAAEMTVQAALNAAPLATPVASSGQNFAPETPVMQLTSTLMPGEVRATFGDTVNCRKGPSVNYDRVMQVKAGDSFPIVGYFPPNFWVISTNAGECWVAGEFTTPVGDAQAVPTVTLPPASVEGAPEAPSFGKNGWSWFCYGSGQTEVTLNWEDNAVNEKGYRIYRNKELVTELSANSTFFKEVLVYPGGEGLQYVVEAFNEAGTSIVSTEVLFCDL